MSYLVVLLETLAVSFEQAAGGVRDHIHIKFVKSTWVGAGVSGK